MQSRAGAPPSARPPAISTLALLSVALVGVSFALRLPLLEVRGFNPDELEHLHFAWRVAQGQVPYRDYFDHHTPALHFLLSPFFSFYQVETVPDDAVAFIFLARRLMWVFTGGILALTFLFGLSWREPRVGFVAALLLSNTGMFLGKTLEVRPDVPATALILFAVLLSSRLDRLDPLSPATRASLLASGVLLGIATLFTQKVLFVLPGFFLAMLVSDLRGWRRRLGLSLAGFALPLAAICVFFAARGALGRFLEFSFLLTARWPRVGASGFINELVREDPLLAATGAGGLAFLGIRALGKSDGQRRDAPLLLSTLSLVTGLAILPYVSRQYFLLFLPMLSLCGAAALLWLSDRFIDSPRRREVVLTLVLLASSIQPMLRLRESFHRGNTATLEGIRFVLRNTAPWETVLDGFTGLGLFRPQAFFYSFLHRDVFTVQTHEEHQQVLEDLRSGRALPKLVFWTHYLREGVSPEVAAFLEANYSPVGREPIRARLFDNGVGWWSDEGPRPLGWSHEASPVPHLLVGEGWRQPENEGGSSVRRARGERARLLVPVRTPSHFRAVVRARRDRGESFRLALSVNGHGAGELPTSPRWQDYEFWVDGARLRSGFNDFVLSRLGASGAAEMVVTHLRLEKAGAPR